MRITSINRAIGRRISFHCNRRIEGIVHTEQQPWQTRARLVYNVGMRWLWCCPSHHRVSLLRATYCAHRHADIHFTAVLTLDLGSQRRETFKMLSGIRLIASAAARSVRAGGCAPRPAAAHPAAAAGQRNLVGFIRCLVRAPIVCSMDIIACNLIQNNIMRVIITCAPVYSVTHACITNLAVFN